MAMFALLVNWIDMVHWIDIQTIVPNYPLISQPKRCLIFVVLSYSYHVCQNRRSAYVQTLHETRQWNAIVSLTSEFQTDLHLASSSQGRTTSNSMIAGDIIIVPPCQVIPVDSEPYV
jgi:hypothetical protein